MDITSIYKPIDQQLSDVDSVISEILTDDASVLADTVGSFISSSPGKRLRPVLMLLCANACSDDTQTAQRLINTAAAVELTHIASLIHDDVIDSASMRHSQPTVNSKWQGSIGIVFGDYVYSKAMKLIVSSDDTRVITCLSETVTDMCRGQLTQVTERRNLDLTSESYLSIIHNKTASLFAASCKIGALLTDADDKSVEACYRFGLNFGLAYQMIDDYRDIIEPQNSLGKTPCQDIALGEITLPIMNLLAVSNPAQKAQIIELLNTSQTSESMQRIKQAFLASNAPQMTKHTISEHIQKAKTSITDFNKTQYTDSLQNLLDMINSKVK